jgi:hypothetical protein
VRTEEASYHIWCRRRKLPTTFGAHGGSFLPHTVSTKEASYHIWCARRKLPTTFGEHEGRKLPTTFGAHRGSFLPHLVMHEGSSPPHLVRNQGSAALGTVDTRQWNKYAHVICLSNQFRCFPTLLENLKTNVCAHKPKLGSLIWAGQVTCKECYIVLNICIQTCQGAAGTEAMRPRTASAD